MGSTMDKVKGKANELAGKGKQGLGEATGSDKLQGEGVMQEAKGHGQQALGDAKEAVKNTADKVAGAAHKNL
ncbi:CsbD family protein [Rhodopseudomonas sp. WA056]|uniref:CsbD family protein n=1 Tax=Rhodopseudomonas palustris (strain DX-1) TaxID=652103 RepID=E6VCD0_RHOPX|nr:CsbD family protein [Rhodopseudomonas sp. WA056]NEW87930.1 CsbD family protein [Rhodopseudomonas sp. WA056]